MISTYLDKNGIKYEFYATKCAQDGMNKVRDFDIDEYSAIVAVGGDGSIHEVINGMLRRPDQKRLPIAFIPNGTGNCTCAEMSILDVQTALTFLVKGDVIKTDRHFQSADGLRR